MTAEPNKIHARPAEFVQPGRLVTPKRLAIFSFLLLSISIGIVALFVPPIYIIGVLIAILFVVLIILYPYFGLLAYSIEQVINPAAIWPDLGAIHPDSLLAGVLLISVVIHKKLKGEPVVLLGEKMTWSFLFFFAAMVASIPTAVWPTLSVSTLIDFARIFLFYLLIINIVNTDLRLKGFLWITMLAGGYTAISSAISYFQGNIMFAQGIERAESLSGADPNTLAVSLVLAVPFLLFSLAWVKNIWLRAVVILFTSSAILTIAITGSRSGILGLVIVLFFSWVLSKHRLITAVALMLLLVVGWIILPDQYKERYKSIFHSEVDASTQGRFDAWKAGLNMFVSRPFLGVGIGCFGVAHASGDYSDRGSWLKAHNMYVQLIAELGLVGVATFAWLIWFMMRQNFRLRKWLKKTPGGEAHNSVSLLLWTSYAITCSTAALFFTCIFGHSLMRTHWYWCCALTVVLWSLANKSLNERTKPDGTDSKSRYRALPKRG